MSGFGIRNFNFRKSSDYNLYAIGFALIFAGAFMPTLFSETFANVDPGLGEQVSFQPNGGFDFNKPSLAPRPTQPAPTTSPFPI